LGVLLTPILKREQTSLRALSGRSFAVDGNIELHQFLAIIRKPDGTLFTDNTGRVTSHLIGLLTRTSTFITDYKMKPVFVFDGRPNPLKWRVIEARREARRKAETEYAEATSKGDYSTAWSKAVMTGRVTREVLEDAKRLLGLMGIPWLEALEDAEAQASYMAGRGDVWAVGSKDYDSLLFGTPILARYLTITGKEYLPAQRRMRPLIPELIKLSENLKLLSLTREQLVDIAILMGTDFNPGVKGIGPKKALNLIRKHGAIEKIPSDIRSSLDFDVDQVREVFLHPKVIETYSLKGSKPDAVGIEDFLCGERAFSQDRVRPVAERLAKAYAHQDRGLKEWL